MHPRHTIAVQHGLDLFHRAGLIDLAQGGADGSLVLRGQRRADETQGLQHAFGGGGEGLELHAVDLR